jgi:hypothetical protein
MPMNEHRLVTDPGRSNLLTVVGVAIIGYAACDMVHEVLGHGLPTLLSSDVRAVMLTTVALSTVGSSRVVVAGGTIANLVAALLAFLVFQRMKGFGATRYFAWLFATLNLLNATGYFILSGFLGSGDWAVVIADLQPQFLWRVMLSLLGLVGYAASTYMSADMLAALVRRGDIRQRDVRRLIVPAYIGGGVLLVAGAALNPIDSALVLSSGASTGFGAMSGLLAIPWLVENRTQDRSGAHPLPLSGGWVISAIGTALIFIVVIGRGIRL